VKSAKFPALLKIRIVFYLTNHLALRRNRNFCLFVANKWKACFCLNFYLRNMVTGNKLATRCVDKAMPLTMDSNIMQTAGCQTRLPVRIAVKLSGVMESQVPIGYEDDGGFHYGAAMAN
jgi:hypothetical protein